ncbi:MAG: APC family permease [Tepidisphaeraceae bacterium]
MATESSPSPTPTAPKATLGLTGLTSNAMALIAPGAFLWLTFVMQLSYGKPIAGIAMWFGILLALALCFATAISYAELSKLYPGAGSSYFFAEQAFLSKKQAYKWARLYKFMVGWASHLYYWVYPGVMVAVTAIVAGYLAGQFWPKIFNAGIPSPLFMVLFCVVFAYGVAYIAYRGVVGATGVNVAINVIQITALIIFSVMAIAYRTNHHEGSAVSTWGLVADSYGNNKAYPYQQAVDAKGNPVFNDDGTPKLDTSNPWKVSYDGGVVMAPDPNDTSANPRLVPTFNQHISAGSVIHPHGLSVTFVQACIAILILVGFESVTSMGEEAKNPKKHIPWAVLLSLAIQGGFCYLFEYFAADYFMHNNYNATTAAGSAAPIGDMMQIVGAWVFGSTQGGWWFMILEAFTVFVALIGTTLSCINTGARVTYAMGRDEEVPAHFGMLHGKNATPHRSIWTLATISVVIGIYGVLFNFCGPAAQADTAVAGVWHYSPWYYFGLFHNSTALKFPCSSLVITLISNFGTFMLYMMTCIIAMVAFHQHHLHNPIKHLFIPAFGLLANLGCMLFYIIGPFSVPGMSPKEPFWALGIAAAWGVYGTIYFIGRSKKLGKEIILSRPTTLSVT